MRLKKFKTLLVSAFILGWVTIAIAFSSGPPPSNTGAPGETNCTQCHSGTLNAPGGSVTISGLPTSYIPGTRYNLTVTVSKSDRSRWGFQATALTDDGSAAGTFETVDANTQKLTSSVQGKSRNYIEHTSTGTRRGTTGSASFNFVWVAPSTDVGQVTFYVIGNAANNNGSSSGDNIYTTTAKLSAAAQVVTPTITTINPTKGPSAGGTTVTVTGSNFKNGATVTFGSKQASTTFVDSSNLVAVSPSGTGVVDIVVTNPDGQVARLSNSFTYEAAGPAPVLAAISPTSGSTSGGTTVTLTGSNFAQGAKVVIGKEATVTSITSTEIKAVTPANDPGPVDVSVINPDGQTAVLNSIFTYVGDNQQPGVSLLSPNGGEVLSSGGLPFDIRWTHSATTGSLQKLELSLDSGATFTSTIVSDLSSDKTSFQFAVPAGVTSEKGRIRITLVDNGVVYTDVSDADFKILPAPTISNVTATVTSTVKLKITGSGFVSGCVIEVDGAAVNTKFKSATSLQAKKLSSSLVGKEIKVRVKNPDGAISLEKTIVP